jgi:hypothetical protein
VYEEAKALYNKIKQTNKLDEGNHQTEVRKVTQLGAAEDAGHSRCKLQKSQIGHTAQRRESGVQACVSFSWRWQDKPKE